MTAPQEAPALQEPAPAPAQPLPTPTLVIPTTPEQVKAQVDAANQAAIDAAYRTKYGHYGASYVDPMFTPEARAATLELVPR